MGKTSVYNLVVAVRRQVSICSTFFAQSTRKEINPDVNRSSGNRGAKTAGRRGGSAIVRAWMTVPKIKIRPRCSNIGRMPVKGKKCRNGHSNTRSVSFENATLSEFNGFNDINLERNSEWLWLYLDSRLKR